MTETAPKLTLLEMAHASAMRLAPGERRVYWPDDLRETLRVAGWTAERLRREIETDDWVVRLVAERAAAGRERQIREYLSTALEGGPIAMAQLSETDLLAGLPATLSELATSWNPGDGGLLIVGPTEIGKTRCAVAIVRRLCTEAPDQRMIRHIVQWARASDLGLARQHAPLGHGEAEIVQRAMAARVLVLDDLGWESRSDAVADVLAARYDTGKSTIVTSGQRPEQLAERYSDAMIRRIVQAGGKHGRIVNAFAKGAEGGRDPIPEPAERLARLEVCG